MKAINSINSHITPLMINDIDTDIIIPAQYLTQIGRQGYGQHAFSRLKAADDFVLNQSPFKNSRILLTGENFGCGSSREHAVWAIQELGYEAIIAPSFADIFSNNARKNGLLLVKLDNQTCQQWAEIASQSQSMCRIDVIARKLQFNDQFHDFQIDPFFQWCLTQGKDELGYLMSMTNQIESWQRQRQAEQLFVDFTGGQP